MQTLLGYVIKYYHNRGTIDAGTFDGCSSWKGISLDASITAYCTPVEPILDNTVFPARIKKYGSLVLLGVFSDNLVKVIKIFNDDADLGATNRSPNGMRLTPTLLDPLLTEFSSGDSYFSAAGTINPDTEVLEHGGSAAFWGTGEVLLTNGYSSAGLYIDGEGDLNILANSVYIGSGEMAFGELAAGYFVVNNGDDRFSLGQGSFSIETNYASLSFDQTTIMLSGNKNLLLTSEDGQFQFATSEFTANSATMYIAKGLTINLPNGQRIELDSSGAKIYTSTVKLGNADATTTTMLPVLCAADFNATRIGDLSEIRVSTVVQAAVEDI